MMSIAPQPHALTQAARDAKWAAAVTMGIDDALIAALVEHFYTTVRADALLGPIFDRHVKDWPVHLGRMKNFWASIAIESGRFNGQPMQKHIGIPGLTATHFAAWLLLWDAAIATVVANGAAAALFRERARRIATSLQTGILLHHGGLDAVRREAIAC